VSRARRGAARLAAEAIYRSGALGPLNRLANRFEPFRRETGDLAFPYVRRRRARTLQILLYHRVSDDPGPFLPATPLAVFRTQVALLSERCTILPLDEAAERLARRDLPDNAVALTFDDGYRDNYLHAFPILREHGATATIFLATDAIGSERLLWHDRVISAFRGTDRTRLASLGDDGPELVWESDDERERVMWRVLADLRDREEPERADRIRRLVEALGGGRAPAHPRLMLTWDEVREMAAAGIGFGGHTRTHPILSRVTPERAREEIVGSKLEIEKRLGAPARCFAYPNGRPGDYDETTKRIVREAGYACAVTTRSGANRADGREDALELRRTGAWEPVRSLFALRITLERLAA
jgi:peptidoglycan/xylan/chitin deacetylase (PgdA/CDA1 family)